MNYLKRNVLLIIFLLILRIQTQCNKGCLKCDTVSKLCVFCDIANDYLLENGKCIFLKYENCLGYDLSGSCTKCNPNFYVNNKACILVPESLLIENCEEYKNEVFCSKCKKDHYFNNG